MADTSSYQEKGIRLQKGTCGSFTYKANAAIGPNLIVIADSSGNVGPATAASLRAVGVTGDVPSYALYDPVDVLTGTVRFTCDGGGIVAGYPLKCGTAGKATALIDSTLAGLALDTSSAGIAFTNQPSNDGVTIVSDAAGDTTQSITIYGTTTGTDTVVLETIALNGVVAVNTTKVDWGQVLAVLLSASCAGTVTVKETSGGLTITTLATTVLSKGLDAVTGTSIATYNVAPTIVGSGATTKQVGLVGTNAAGTTIYDSQALNGATPVIMNSSFRTVTYFLTGDLEATRTAALAVGAEEDDDLKIGRAIENQTVDGDTFWGHFVP